MMLTIKTGCPPDAAARSAPERETYRFLDALGIPYSRVDHEATPTMESCREIDRVLGTEMCKNLFLCNRQKTCFYLLLIRDGKPFRTKDISAQLGVARLSFGAPEEMRELLGVEPGSLTVLALRNNTAKRVRLLIDDELLSQPYLGCHPCVNTASLRVATRDILDRFLPAVEHDYTAVTVPETED